MDVTQAVAFLRENHRAVMATRRRSGGVQMSPVTVAADDDGRALVSTREPSMKARNIARDPAVSLCVFTDNYFGGWVQIDGRADVIRLPDAMELLVDYYRRVAGEHPDWDDYRAAMEREKRVMLRIIPQAAGPNASG